MPKHAAPTPRPPRKAHARTFRAFEAWGPMPVPGKPCGKGRRAWTTTGGFARAPRGARLRRRARGWQWLAPQKLARRRHPPVHASATRDWRAGLHLQSPTRHLFPWPALPAQPPPLPCRERQGPGAAGVSPACPAGPCGSASPLLQPFQRSQQAPLPAVCGKGGPWTAAAARPGRASPPQDQKRLPVTTRASNARAACLTPEQ